MDGEEKNKTGDDVKQEGAQADNGKIDVKDEGAAGAAGEAVKTDTGLPPDGSPGTSEKPAEENKEAQATPVPPVPEAPAVPEGKEEETKEYKIGDIVTTLTDGECAEIDSIQEDVAAIRKTSAEVIHQLNQMNKKLGDEQRKFWAKMDKKYSIPDPEKYIIAYDRAKKALLIREIVPQRPPMPQAGETVPAGAPEASKK